MAPFRPVWPHMVPLWNLWNLCNLVPETQWMPPNEYNQVRSTKWMQPSEFSQQNVTNRMQLIEFNHMKTANWLQPIEDKQDVPSSVPVKASKASKTGSQLVWYTDNQYRQLSNFFSESFPRMPIKMELLLSLEGEDRWVFAEQQGWPLFSWLILTSLFFSSLVLGCTLLFSLSLLEPYGLILCFILSVEKHT